jgi:hypothetical protein
MEKPSFVRPSTWSRFAIGRISSRARRSDIILLRPSKGSVEGIENSLLATGTEDGPEGGVSGDLFRLIGAIFIDSSIEGAAARRAADAGAGQEIFNFILIMDGELVISRKELLHFSMIGLSLVQGRTERPGRLGPKESLSTAQASVIPYFQPIHLLLAMVRKDLQTFSRIQMNLSFVTPFSY